MDANFGATAGIAEMLLQSHAGMIHLLPALPAVWPAGEVSGLRARGNITVGMIWEHGQLTQAELAAEKDGEVRIEYGDTYLDIALKKDKVSVLILKGKIHVVQQKNRRYRNGKHG